MPANYTNEDCRNRDSVLLKDDCIYRHQLMRFNYTTYDVRRGQDVINPSTPHCNILLLANKDKGTHPESDHPFLYARVLRIYHANVPPQICPPTTTKVSFGFSILLSVMFNNVHRNQVIVLSARLRCRRQWE